jgi:hypothetical protein
VPGVADTKQATRLVKVLEPLADPTHPLNAKRRIIVPKAVTERVADAFVRSPSKKEALRVLVYLQREQLKRGAIEVLDNDLARLLALEARKVRAIREWAVDTGVLRMVSEGSVAPIYVFASGATIYESRVGEGGFDTKRTRRFQPLYFEEKTYVVFANEGQLEATAHQLAALPPAEAISIIENSADWSAGHSALQPILIALARSVRERSSPSSGTQGVEYGND